MNNLYIDPLLFACPNLDSDFITVEKYINNLLDWTELKNSKWLKIFSLEETFEILHSSLKYPLWDDLKAVFNKFQIDYIQPKDIVNIVDALLQKANSIQAELAISDYLADSVVIHPKIINREDLYLNKFLDLAVYNSLNCHFNKLDQKENVILTRDLSFDEIRIETKVVMVYSTRIEDVIYPLDLDYKFKLCLNFEQLYTCVSSSDIWQYADDEENYKTSIRFNINSHLKNSNLPIFATLESVNFGKVFIQTLMPFNFDSNLVRIKMLLDCINDILLNQNMQDVHSLRNGKGGDAAQIETKDGYKAWRRDIDYEFHIHYWKKGSDLILANLVPHNDFDITWP